MDAEIKAAIAGSVQSALENLRGQMLSGKTPDLAAAYVAFWGQVGNVTKDAQNPHLKNNYATLEACLRVTKPPLSANGLALLTCPGPMSEGKMSVLTMLVHKSGQAWSFNTELPFGEGLDKKTGLMKPATPQNAGSVITYARRYITLAIAGIAPVDDDGEAASVIVETEAAATPEDTKDLEDGMTAFKAKKAEKVKETLDRFKTQFADRVTAAGSEQLLKVYMDKRTALRVTDTDKKAV